MSLGLFSSPPDLSSSSDDNDSDSEESSQITSDDQPSTLPPPLEALSSATVPDFVTSHLSKGLDWDSLKKDAPIVEAREPRPWETDLPSVVVRPKIFDSRPDIALTKQVPQSYIHSSKEKKQMTSSPRPVVDYAITWSKMYGDGGVSEDKPQTGAKRPHFDDPDLEGFCHTDVSKDKVAFGKKGAKRKRAKN